MDVDSKFRQGWVIAGATILLYLVVNHNLRNQLSINTIVESPKIMCNFLVRDQNSIEAPNIQAKFHLSP